MNNKTSLLNVKPRLSKLSVPELKALEKDISIELSRARHGTIDDAFAGYEREELVQVLLEQRITVQNTITARNIRG